MLMVLWVVSSKKSAGSQPPSAPCSQTWSNSSKSLPTQMSRAVIAVEIPQADGQRLRGLGELLALPASVLLQVDVDGTRRIKRYCCRTPPDVRRRRSR